MYKKPIDKQGRPGIILRATGYGHSKKRTADGRPYGCCVRAIECESVGRRGGFIGYENFFRRVSFMEVR